MNRTFIHTDSTTAEFIKYMNNNFFATKVSLMNEYYRLAKSTGVDWEIALPGFAADQRIGDSVTFQDQIIPVWWHLFPKDINAFISYAKEKG